VQEAFGTLIFAVVIIASIVAVYTVATVDRVYDQIGRGAMSINEDVDHRSARAGGGVALPGERDDEIRQMLRAANDRRARRGEPALDIEQELRRLTAPAVDPELRAEIVSLVIARNARRARMGREPFDVDTEVERQIRDLGS
jgi:hypothetical protein